MHEGTDDSVRLLIAGATSPDPSVQRANLVTLSALEARPSAGALAQCVQVFVAEDQSLSSRLAAASVLRRVMSANPMGAAALAGSALQPHMSAVMSVAGSEEAALRGASASLTVAAATAAKTAKDSALCQWLWASAFQHVLLAGQPAAAQTARACLSAAVLLRVLCEDAPADLRAFVSDVAAEGSRSPARVLGLCDALSCLVAASAHALAAESLPLSQLTVSAFTELIAAVIACVEEGVLPLADPCDVGISGGGQDAGPAAQALNTALSSVAALHDVVVRALCSCVLPQIDAVISAAAAAASALGDVDQQASSLIAAGQCAALFSSVVAYLAATASVGRAAISTAREHLLGSFLPLVLRLWALGPVLAQGAPPDTALGLHRAVRVSLTALADIALLGDSPSFAASLPQLLNAILQLSSMPAEAVSGPLHGAREIDCDVPDDPATVAVCLRGARAGKLTLQNGASDIDEEENSKDDDDDDDDGANVLTRWRGGAASATVRADEQCAPALLADSSSSRGRVCETDGVGDVKGLRELVRTLLNNTSISYGSDGQLVEYLFCPSLGILRALQQPTTADPVLAEAALFVLNEVVEGCLTSATAPDQVRPVIEVVSFLLQALKGSPHAHDALPFYVRAQAVELLARATAAAVEGLLQHHSVAAAEALRVVHPDEVVRALVTCLSNERSKLVQQALLKSLSLLLAACLCECTDTVEEDDDNDDDSDDDPPTDKEEARAASPRTELLTVVFDVSMDSPVQLVFLTAAAMLPGLQLGPRTAAYDLFRDIIPCLPDAGVPLCPLAVQRVLEALAQQYMALAAAFNATTPSAFHEAAYLLACLSDVASSVGPLLAPALGWLAQAYTHVMRALLSADTESGARTRGVDLEDMGVLALDLLSAACDALLDREALLTAHAGATAAENLAQLQCAFGDGSGAPSVMYSCLCVLQKYRLPPQQQQQSPCGEQTCNGSSRSNVDAHDELKRACFGLLYDCYYVATPSARAEVFSAVLASCLDDGLYSFVTAASPARGLRVLRTRACASNALLCLSEILSMPHGAAVADSGPGGEPLWEVLRRPCDALSECLRTRSKDLLALPLSTRLNMVGALSAAGAAIAAALSVDAQGTDVLPRSTVWLQAVSAHLGDYHTSESAECHECVQTLAGVLQILHRVASQAAGQTLFDALARCHLLAAVARAVAAAAACAQTLSARGAALPGREDWASLAELVLASQNSTGLTKKEQRHIRALLLPVRTGQR